MAIKETEIRPIDQTAKRELLHPNGKLKGRGRRITPQATARVVDRLVENCGDYPPLDIPGEAFIASTTPSDPNVLEEQTQKFWLTETGKRVLEKGKQIIPKVDNTGTKVLIGTGAAIAAGITAYEVYKHHIKNKRAEES